MKLEHERAIAEGRQRMAERRVRAAWAAAGIPSTFAGFRLETYPRASPLVDRLRTAVVQQSLFLTGPVGVGKTGLAIGYAWSWLERTGGRKSIRFIKLPQLLRKLRSSFNAAGVTEAQLLEPLTSCGLLILDDLGAEHSRSDWLQDVLYDLIGERHDEGRPIIITSNLSLPELAEQKIGERIASRIAGMCGGWQVEVTGRDLRMG